MAPVVQAITEHLESALNLLEAAIPETPNKRRSRKAPQKEA